MEALSGDEPLTFEGEPIDATLLDFWRWSSSDIVGNRLRGILAEFLVGRALGDDSTTRTEWDAYDVLTPEGAKVEVKSAGFVQSWDQNAPSKISFDIARKRGWDARANEFASKPTRTADVYVFCLHAHTDEANLNPLAIDQWEFFVISTKELDHQVGNQKTIALSRLEEIGAIRTEFVDLKEQVDRCSG